MNPSNRKKAAATAPAAESPDGADKRRLARLALRPEATAAIAIEELHRKSLPGIDLNDLVAELTEMTGRLADGDLRHVESMLLSQAAALDTMFLTLLRRALLQDTLPQYEAHMRFALRAQAQARATLEAIGQLKNPPVVIAKQANVGGNVQVNNGIPTRYAQARARENQESEPDRLLGDQDGERLDTRETRTPGRGDPTLAPLGEIDRAAHARGQGGGGG